MSSPDPLCFRCVYFKQYQPLNFRTPGECKWTPREAVPPWLQAFLECTDKYHGPDRQVTTMLHFKVTECEAFKERTDG